MSTEPTPLHALLIGIDCYLPHRLPDGTEYPNLGGCVRDVARLEAFLRERLAVPEERITRLTATTGPDGRPAEPPEIWPTYEKMVAAIRRLGQVARPGERVHLHYSGHGGRAATILPQVKGERGIDEVLVPTDIGDSEGRYLRDVELGRLLDELVRRGLVVSVVLDSCHSGGMTRGGKAADGRLRGAVPRGRGVVDVAPRRAESLVGSPAELAETWRELSAGPARGFWLGSGWLPEPRGYVLLAACRPSERAYEYPFEGGEYGGVLTHWLLHALEEMTPGTTYKAVHDRILAHTHGPLQRQTPLLQGEGDRVVFGADRVAPAPAALVLRVGTNGRVLVGMGQAQGLRAGAQLALYPPGGGTLEEAGARLAVATVTQVEATESWAALERPLPAVPIEPGARAVLLEAGPLQLVRGVRLLRGEGPPEAAAALDALSRALVSRGSGWVREVGADEPGADYQVAVTAEGEYEVLDAAGEAVANLRPALPVSGAGAAGTLAARLAHLARYRAVLELENHDAHSPPAGKLTAEIAGRQVEHDPAERPRPLPLEDAGNAVRRGEWVFLRIRNDSTRVLNVTVLDLQPDWGISQLYPEGAGDLFVPLDPGEEKLLSLRTDLPEGYTEGRDVLKVFATRGTSNFRVLELSALDQPHRPKRVTRSPQDALGRLLAMVAAERPPMRHLAPAAYPSGEWSCVTVPVTILGGP